ncbi:hypothetical protein [Neisseria shayeganii]|uniref:Phosphoribosylaminoimidazole-succinocarboxamide synthetase n=1 Tax=Neisseria shayeganii 871 TaxID=1032488 RepID=G4CG59_9NEIS|nr:hypothetical protein [Neisseria shayeganii]EGY53107.1 phosphoribosylaminoimidazole-succinocarboxamide synthetase [Neisseria shayeganii 871]
MTQQFKFGDLVRHKETGNIGSVVDFKFGVVVALHGDTHLDTFGEDELELIPHPDTVRLERIGRLTVESMGMKFDLDEYRRQIDTTIQKEKNA